MGWQNVKRAIQPFRPGRERSYRGIGESFRRINRHRYRGVRTLLGRAVSVITSIWFPDNYDSLRANQKRSVMKFSKRVSELGASITDKTWYTSHDNVSCICSAGHVCTPKPHGVINGDGICKICAGNDSGVAQHRFKAIVTDLGGQVIGTYVNNRTAVKCICPSGHECDTRPDNVLQGRGMCWLCSGRSPVMGEQRFNSRIRDLGGTIIGSYINSMTSVECRCKEGHICNPTPNGVLNAKGMCSICAKNDKDTSAARFYEAVEVVYGGRVIGDYINTNTPVYCICPWGHDWWPRPTNVLSHMTVCRKCSVEHTAFYVVTDGVNIKLGVSSGLAVSRLGDHKRDGYKTALFLVTNLPSNVADNTEIKMLQALKDQNIKPIKGREYFGPEAKEIVMQLVSTYFGRGNCFSAQDASALVAALGNITNLNGITAAIADSEPFWGGN